MSAHLRGPGDWPIDPLFPEKSSWCFGHFYTGDTVTAALDEVDCLACQPVALRIAAERARCRAIVFRLFGKDYTGNEALAEIDRGGP